jgi:hypothetical protein
MGRTAKMDRFEWDDLAETERKVSTIRSIVTGTKVYGPIDYNSDIDIVVHYKEAELIEGVLLKHGLKVERTDAQVGYGELGGFYFEIGGLLFNIICAEDEEELDIWRRATIKMRFRAPVINREERLEVFSRMEMEAIEEKGVDTK